jgi:hypothetical protein
MLYKNTTTMDSSFTANSVYGTFDYKVVQHGNAFSIDSDYAGI